MYHSVNIIYKLLVLRSHLFYFSEHNKQCYAMQYYKQYQSLDDVQQRATIADIEGFDFQYKTSVQRTGHTFDRLIWIWLQFYIRYYRLHRLLIVLQFVGSMMPKSKNNQLNIKRTNLKKVVRKTLLESDQ